MRERERERDGVLESEQVLESHKVHVTEKQATFVGYPMELWVIRLNLQRLNTFTNPPITFF